MTQTHPITPPPELVQQWFLGAKAIPVDQWVTDVATKAARWGADQELEACCGWLRSKVREPAIDALRAARRTKPPTLKEQALKLIETYECPGGVKLTPEQCDTIRRALEALDV